MIYKGKKYLTPEESKKRIEMGIRKDAKEFARTVINMQKKQKIDSQEEQYV